MSSWCHCPARQKPLGAAPPAAHVEPTVRTLIHSQQQALLHLQDRNTKISRQYTEDCHPQYPFHSSGATRVQIKDTNANPQPKPHTGPKNNNIKDTSTNLLIDFLKSCLKQRLLLRRKRAFSDGATKQGEVIPQLAIVTAHQKEVGYIIVRWEGKSIHQKTASVSLGVSMATVGKGKRRELTQLHQQLEAIRVFGAWEEIATVQNISLT